MDVVYEILDGLHVFIPVIAIVACVIIFVCGMRSSKSAQPPDEYLQEIKANAAKSKTRNKSSKTQSSSPSSPKSSENHIAEKVVKSSSVETKREKPTKAEEKQPPKVEAKKTTKSTKKSSSDASPEKSPVKKGVKEADEWVTVTPKRKQQKEGGASPSVPYKNTFNETVSTPEDEIKKFTAEDFPKLDEKVQPTADKVVANETESKVSRQEAAIENHQSLDEAIEDDDVWSVQTAKDSRYRKVPKKQKVSKNDVLIEENLISPQIESFSNSEMDQTKSNEARKRRNVRRDN